MEIVSKDDFSKESNLPRKTIPTDGDLTKREGYFLERIQNETRYQFVINRNKTQKGKSYKIQEFPTYIEKRMDATAIMNKILKDILDRYQVMSGNIVEHKMLFSNHADLVRINGANKENLEEFFKNSNKKFADIVRKQIYEINNIGTIKDYNRYNLSTNSMDFRDVMFSKFVELLKDDRLKKQIRPIHWCPNCKSQVDKHSLMYRKHRVDSVYVLYKVKDDCSYLAKYSNLNNTYVISTTINPYVMLTNEYMAIVKDSTYDLVEIYTNHQTMHYIIESSCTKEVMNSAFYFEYKVLEKIPSDVLKKFVVSNPLDYTKNLEFIESSKENILVDTENTSGIRIVSNGETYLDYLILKENDILNNMRSSLDENGDTYNTTYMFPSMHYSDVNKSIVKVLMKSENLFLTKPCIVSMPDCKMCNETLIYRPLSQWYVIKKDEDFLDEDKVKILNDKLTSDAKFEDEELKSIVNKINNIKEIIISDNKITGTPTPAFICANCNNIICSNETNEYVKNAFREVGIANWDKLLPEDILKEKCVCPKCDCEFLFKDETKLNEFFKVMSIPLYDEKYEKNFVVENKEMFIQKLLALSFDGKFLDEINKVSKVMAHSDVYEETKTMAKPLFLEDNDFEGNEDLIKTEIGIRDVVKKYGTDVLRLWTVSKANENIIKINDKYIEDINKKYKKIRKTFKFILGNLYDFNPLRNNIKVENRTDLDKYMYIKMMDFLNKARSNYDNLEFTKLFNNISRFCSVELCSKYFDALKYRLYMYNKDDLERRSAQSSIFDIFMILVNIVEPILPFTSEEMWPFIWHRSTEEEGNLLLTRLNVETVDNSFENEVKKWNFIFNLKQKLSKYIHKAQNDKLIKKSLEAKMIIEIEDKKYEILNMFKEDLKRTLNISVLELKKSDKESITVEKAPGIPCSRCQNLSTEIGINLKYRYLCPDCANMLEKNVNKNKSNK